MEQTITIIAIIISGENNKPEYRDRDLSHGGTSE